MRKIASSGKTLCSSRLSAWAEARSCPNGFSTTMRVPLGAQPESLSAWATVPNSDGGIAR